MSIVSDRYLEWKNNGVVGELSEEEKIDAFYKELEFGTGGLRGKIGQGTNRMNFQTVGRATFGLAEYLVKKFSAPSIAIAYDSRKFSKEFATLAAEIMSSKGVKVYIFSELMPTPVLSYAVRTLKTSSGIVITASHNPKAYNGYKVYNENGCQITDEVAKEITAEIENSKYFNGFTKNDSLITYLGLDTLNAFIDEVVKYSLNAVKPENTPKIVYTPLNGTGRKPVALLLEKMGVKGVEIVSEQEMPDCEFTTCPYPNPEEDSALALAYRDADKFGAELVLATDPDADRVGVAERDADGKMHRFSGNEVGLILLDYVLKNKKLPKNATVVKTIVTSDLGRKIAEKYGVKIKDVLTGFKYIGEQIDTLESQNDFMFGFEESCGYLVGTYARDKDSIGAVMLVVEAASYYKSQGKSLIQAMNDIYAEHGYIQTYLQSIAFEGADGAKQKEALIAKIRSNPPKTVAGKAVISFKDYKQGIDGLPVSDVMEFSGDDFKFIVRPSGTEPKLKIYYFANGKTEALADGNLTALREDVKKIL